MPALQQSPQFSDNAQLKANCPLFTIVAYKKLIFNQFLDFNLVIFYRFKSYFIKSELFDTRCGAFYW